MKPALLLAPIALALLSGCSGEPAADSTDGKVLYNHYCADCHKADGSGSFLEGVPANRETAMSEAQLVRVILHGKASMPNMPNFGHLSEEQAKAIAVYVHEEL